ncbi:MAG: glycosyltransferase family 4 protein [Cyclobacteriaceae bacterium]|nr:glycosyltransferase family 4 protein [Cyclobacteriaceae bacterium]
MNILLIHQHFNTPESGGAIRSYYLASALVNKGHRVTVITSGACSQGRHDTVEGIEVVYLAIPYNNRFNFLARSLAFLRFAFAAVRAAAPYRHYDFCYAISVPLTVGWCAQWLKWRYGMPYWFEVGDLWPDAPIELGFIRNRLFKGFLRRAEASIYRGAFGVVALSEPIRRAVLGKVPGCRVELIPNMADCDFYTPQTKDPNLETRWGKAGNFVIAYIGALGMANGLHHLIACALAAQRSNLPVTLLVCGDGAMLDELKASVAHQELSNVVFTGFVNRDGVREIMKETDAVFVSYLPSPILETGCPNKYFDGLASGKLIIVNFGGWIRTETEQAGCGVFVDQSDPHAFVRQLEPFIRDPSRLAEAQRRARHLGEERYSRRQLGDDFAALFASS